MIFYRYFILIIGFFILNINSVFPQVKSLSYWENRFLKSWDKEYKKALPMSLSGDSWQLYNIAYYIDANTVMYDVTGKTKYLDRALLYINNIINTSNFSTSFKNSQFRDGFKGWVNYTAPSYRNDQKEYPLFESYCWRYVTGLLVVMKKNGDDESIVYSSQYKKVLDFTLNNIYNKWESRGKKNLYRSNTHMMSHWVKISMDLYHITHDYKYMQIIVDFVQKFKAILEYYNGANGKSYIKWKSAWNYSGRYQDVAHGNAVVGLLVELYENNLGISYSDILNLINLFNKIIWKNENTFAKYIDGTGSGVGWFTDGFIKLGRFDVALQKRIERHNKGRTTQFFANGALNAKRLLK